MVCFELETEIVADISCQRRDADIMGVILQSHSLPAEIFHESNLPTKCTLAICSLEVCNHQSYLSYPPTASGGRGYLLT